MTVRVRKMEVQEYESYGATADKDGARAYLRVILNSVLKMERRIKFIVHMLVAYQMTDSSGISESIWS